MTGNPNEYDERRYQTEHEWRLQMLGALQRIEGILAHLCWLLERPDLHVEKEPVAATAEPPEVEELPTWILTDERVSQVEEAVELEQRVRGRAYGA